MRYILNDEGYIYDVSFGAEILCNLGTCTEYTGNIPDGYSTIEEWHDEEINKLNAWKIVDGNLVFDENKCNELQAKWKKEEEENSCATKKYVDDKFSQSTDVIVDEFSNTEEDIQVIRLEDSGDYDINDLKIDLSNNMYLKYKGAMYQATEPTIENPVTIQSITGNSTVKAQNKNWLQTGNISSVDGITVTKINETTYKFNGTCTKAGRLLATKTFDIDEQSYYTISYKVISGTKTNGAMHAYAYVGNDSWSRLTEACTINSSSGSIKASQKNSQAQFGLWVAVDTVVDDFIVSFQFEEGDTATKYIEHKSQTFPLSLGNIELYGDGEHNDCIYKKNGKWFKYSQWLKTVFTGNETRWNNQFGPSLFNIQSYETNVSKTILKGYSNYYKYNKVQSGMDATLTNGEFALQVINVTGKHIFIKNTNYNNVDDWKAHLKSLYDNGTPLYVLALMDTPTETEITDTTLLSQLETITNELKLDKDTTYFNLTSENGLSVDLPMYYEGGLQLKITNRNLIKNNAVSQTVNGVEATINEDKTITLNGTATADTEIVLNGSDANTDMLFLMKDNLEYYQSGLIRGVNIALYNFDGMDKTKINDTGNGSIILSQNQVVTEVVLNIANGTTFSNEKIFPTLSISDTPKEYLEGNDNDLIKIDLSNILFNTGDYLEIKEDKISFVSGKKEEELQSLDETLKTFYPETYVMLDNTNNISINYYRDKYFQNTINEIKKDIDSISLVVEESIQSTGTVTNTNVLHIENPFIPSNLVELRIKGEMSLVIPSENLFPSEDLFPLNSYLIHDKTETLSSAAKKYFLPLNYLRYMNENVYDELILTSEECQIIRRVGENTNGLYYALENEDIETFSGITIPMFQGDNYIYLEDFKDSKLVYTAIYETNNTLKGNYVQKSTFEVAVDGINAEVSRKVGDDEIISKINMTPEEILINASKVNLQGLVKVTDLSGSGTTTIDGSNIKTGKISSERIDAENLVVGSSNASTEISAHPIEWLEGRVSSPSGDSENPITYFGAYNSSMMHDPRNSVGVMIWENGELFLRRVYTESGADGTSYMGFIKTVLATDASASINYMIGHTSAGSRGLNINTYAESFDVYAETSDERLKENITDAEIDGMGIVNKIRLISFNWKDTGEYQALGFSAQQLQTICKDFVNAVKQPASSEYDEILQVRDFNILPYAIKGLQEINSELTEIKAKVKDLEEENTNLKSIIKDLTKRIENLEKGENNG